MTARTALLIAWGAFAAAVLAFVLLSALAAAQSPTICSNGVCVMPESDLRDLLFYLKHLEKISEGKCA